MRRRTGRGRPDRTRGRSPRPVRDAILSGQFVGSRDPALATGQPSFLGAAARRCDRSLVRRRERRASAHRRSGAARRARPRHRRDRCHAVRAARCHPAPPTAAQAGGHLARARLARGRRWSPRSAQGQGAEPRLAGDSAATSNAPSSSTRASCSARFTRRSSARRAASRTACWWSITRCGIGRPTARRTDDVTALASLAGVAAAAFAPIVIGASPALLRGRRASPISPRRPISPTRCATPSTRAGAACRRAPTCASSGSPCRGCSRRPPWLDDRHARRRLPL